MCANFQTFGIEWDIYENGLDGNRMEKRLISAYHESKQRGIEMFPAYIPNSSGRFPIN